MLKYNIYKRLEESLNSFIELSENIPNFEINEAYTIKDVRKVSSFSEPNKRYRGKDKIAKEKEQHKKIVDIKTNTDEYNVIRNNIKDTISPIFNIYITKHTKDQIKKRSNTHDTDYPLRSVELILPYIAKSLINGTLRPNSKFAFAFEGDHIGFICTINTTHSEQSKKYNNSGDIEIPPSIDIIVRSAIQPEPRTGKIYVDIFTKSLIFTR